MENFKAIILAAGEGTRMKSKQPKVLHKILNKHMIEYVIHAADSSGASDICIVVGHKSDDVKKSIHNEKIIYALQSDQMGTGHAVMMAEDFIDVNKDIVVLYGDTPLITSETLVKLIEFHRREENGVSIISAIVDDPTGYGHIIRNKDGIFLKNVEHKDATDNERLVKEINTGIYCFNGAKLKEAIGKLTNNNSQKEYYLPDTLEIILNGGSSVNAMKAEDVTEFSGVNSRAQLAEAEMLMRKRINKKHMDNGVTMIDPNQTYIDEDVVIGCDTIIYPGTILEGKTVIGEDCLVGPSSRITNTVIKNGVKIQYATALDSEIGNNSTVGPYAYIRPNSKIGENVKIGDFVEVKNSVIGNNTKISHLTYVGDSDVGEKINFGCGTITVNYDGSKKFRTVIEDNVFIGCNANLVAPVTIKKDSYIAAGSTITKDVPEKALAVARARQENKMGWTKKSWLCSNLRKLVMQFL